MPAFVVFSDATLVAIADANPADQQALSRVPGIGAVKLERYAVPVLAVLSGAAPESVDLVAIG